MPRSSDRRLRAFAWLLLTLLSACGGAQRSASEAQAEQAPLELTLARSDRSLFPLSSLRGTPTLLFLFATYDSASQLALTHLERVLSQTPELRALGIALQPDARVFLDAYRDALSVSFPLAFDPDNAILGRKTALGRIESVPALVLLDAEGHVRGVRYGVTAEPELLRFVAPVLGD